MCGIAGYLSISKNRVASRQFKVAVETLFHRGPDDFGYALFDAAKELSLFTDEPERENIHSDLILGHRRLSIIDLSPAGRQPMTDESGRFWIVYNGEVYNYIELKEELKSRGYAFRTNSDTEVILKAYEEWGTECLNRFNGMFAFALWDVKKKTLFCARDRVGVKPFYYYHDGKRFIFASEIKGLLKAGIERKINNQIVYDYLSSGLLDHTEDTFFEGIKQLRPAHYLMISKDGLTLKRWWDIEDRELSGCSDEEYARRFYELFEDSVRLRLRSDVPVGTCLSGGLDSSTIVCVANSFMFKGDYLKDVVGERQRTFSSCFEDRKYDERVFIEEVVKKTNVASHYTFPEGEKLFDIIPDVIYHQDEPFGSTSIFAQWHVMKLAKENGIKVLLDGQGADELLAGYHGYFGAYYTELLKGLHILKFLHELFSYKKIYGKLQPMMFAAMARAVLPDIFISMLRKTSFIPKAATCTWLDGDFEKKYRRGLPAANRFRSPFKNHLYTLFACTSLPALLRYEDRNSMAHAIEARVPFLDYRLVEYIFSLPSEQKISNGMTKAVLRNATKGILPEKVRMRVDKMGFVTPENVWFRTFLKNRISDIIKSSGFHELGYFNIPEVKKTFTSHCRDEADMGFTIWRWVNLVLWREMFIKRSK